MHDLIQNHTKEQEEEWHVAKNKLCQLTGSWAAIDGIVRRTNKYMEDNHLDTRLGYAYAIQLANQKLNVPVLDDIEYHEIIRGQEIMDELTNV